MTMSGWANYDKQPWRYGEPYTSYNRAMLKLKVRMTPYQYSYSYIANTTGVPPIRPLVLEYPDDPQTWDNSTGYQFLSGEWFLVAPVYENVTVRSGIYLPKGEWIDYWNGTRWAGPLMVNNYVAPLNVLPVFVKAGAIIPMWPEMNYFNEKLHDPITLDLYPSQDGGSASPTSFTLYEDDGVTREFSNGASATQQLTMTPTANVLTVTIGSSVGSYSGKPTARGYVLTVHTAVHPRTVVLNSTPLKEYQSQSTYDAATQGFFYVANSTMSVLWVKTGSLSLSNSATVAIAA